MIESECAFVFVFFLQERAVPYLHKVFISTLAILFNETKLDQLPESVVQLRMRNSCLEGREVKCVNAIAGGEGPRLYVP